MTQEDKFAAEEFYDAIHAERRSPVLSKALEILSDGEWHDREEVIREVQKLVTPGIAYRHMEEARRLQMDRSAQRMFGPEEYEKWRADPANWARKRPIKDENDYIRRGQRAVAISHTTSSKRLERRKIDGKMMIRRVPMNARLLESDAARLRAFTAEQ